ncbi:MAG: hypothetical protein CVV28_10115 [Methanobacteriales archaeon HGW-Methanobacteriales-1]|jgi:predicted RNase H-like HicB family nuclease|nr:MAG: hypothetical protein CVV28_10115 [Methanobacteriales archaeon HGW-Methanobacteriales-1]
MQIKLELPIEITQEDEIVMAICPIFNVGSQGNTENEALDNAREALEIYLEDKDIQRQNIDKIFKYAVSFIFTDKKRKIIDDLNHPEHQVELDVEFNAFSETSNPVIA